MDLLPQIAISAQQTTVDYATQAEQLWNSLPDEVKGIIVILALLLSLKALNGIASSSSASSSGKTYRRSHLVQADPDTFEELVADAFEVRGYDTRVTQRSNDKGVDVVANGPNGTIVVQAKRYQTGNKVSSPTVQQIAGAATQWGADRAAIATSSSFTDPAQKAAAQTDVELLDGHDMVQLLNQQAS